MLQQLKPHHFYFLILTIILVSCGKEAKQDSFLIAPDQIGSLTPSITVKQLDSIFKKDSIVKTKPNSPLLASENRIEIFEKGGKKLLVLEATEKENPDATIEYIQLIDPRYHTESGISPTSVFKDIKDNYPISKINNMLSTAVIFVDSLKATFTIDKKELPAALRAGTSIKIEAAQIPDSAKIKHFMIGWDK